MPDPARPQPKWKVAHLEPEKYKKFAKRFGRRLDEWLQTQVPMRFEDFQTQLQNREHFKCLTDGVFEMRLRKDSRVLVRLFFFDPFGQFFVVVGFYDKKRHTVEDYQQDQIEVAVSRKRKFEAGEYVN